MTNPSEYDPNGQIYDFDQWFFAICQTVSRKSKDPSTKVGCVVVGHDREVRALGYNGFPRGYPDNRDGDKERKRKYPLTIHAEANAIANAARIGTSLKGCDLYTTHPPCADCAGLIIQSGIKFVRWLRPTGDFSGRWKESFDLAKEMFREVGISTCEHNK